MNVILQTAIAATIAAIIFGSAWLIVIPYIRLQMKRKESRAHMPQAEEIWVQDDGILYIDEVNQSGVNIMTITVAKDGTQNFQRWKDSWEEWHARLHTRTVFFTGQKRPLGNF